MLGRVWTIAAVADAIDDHANERAALTRAARSRSDGASAPENGRSSTEGQRLAAAARRDPPASAPVTARLCVAFVAFMRLF
jgi:hypothetical protein